MLLYAVGAMRIEPGDKPNWFRRIDGAYGAVISRVEDVADILMRLPDDWNKVEDARVDGLHDDEDIMADDARVSGRFRGSGYAVIEHAASNSYVLLLQVDAADSILLPDRPFKKRAGFHECIPGLE